ncbi:MAG: hypothetical protein WA738_20600 [Candidatus Angelobacter sp.]
MFEDGSRRRGDRESHVIRVRIGPLFANSRYFDAFGGGKKPPSNAPLLLLTVLWLQQIECRFEQTSIADIGQRMFSDIAV